jgi:hypothetical protein
MNIQSIFICWQKSLESIKKDNLKMFLLGTLATTLRSAKTLGLLFGWLFAAIWTIQGFLAQHQSLIVVSLLMVIVHIPLIYAMLLTVRPSLETKNYDYYRAYLPSIFALIGLKLILSKALLLLIGVLPLLFFLDSDLSFPAFFKSIERGVKALVYFFPSFIITAVFYIILHASITSLSIFISHVWSAWLIYVIFFAIEDILLLLAISAFTVYYTKLKHEHFDLLFS